MNGLGAMPETSGAVGVIGAGGLGASFVFGVFGCFDFALTGGGDDPGHWTAIECNPNGQWGWLPDAEQITEAFADILSRKEAAGHDHARRL